MLLLHLGELIVGQEEHMQSLSVLNLKLVSVGLGLLNLFSRVVAGALKHVNGLNEHRHVKLLVCQLLLLLCHFPSTIFWRVYIL